MKLIFKQFKHILSFLIFLSVCCAASGQTQQEMENVKVQMNYCISSLTNIINNHSMTVLTYEADQILNNLKITEIRDEQELQNFRTELFDAIKNLQITEQEKEILNRVQDLKSNNLMWKSLSGALNPTMLITGGGKTGLQIAFQAIVTAARAVVDYQSTKGEQEIEEIQAMWDIKKKELETIGNLRTNALKICFALYKKYPFLGEWDRLTEETAKRFCDNINEPKAQKRVRLLKGNESLFKMLPDYYYYLGMAYLGDAPDGSDASYKDALPYLDEYLEKYKRTPIFRYDQKSGIIALTKLAYEPSMPQDKKEELIQMAMANLPNNGAALLQCALVYIRELNNKVKGYQLLCSGLDNDYSNKDAILSTITSFLDDIKKYPTIYDEICSAVNECQTIGLNEYIPFLLARGDDNWKIITNEFSIVKGPVIKFKSDRHFDYGSVKIYKVNSSEERMSITQQDLFPEKSFTEKELKKKVDVFNVKGNESLMYKFIDPIIYGERYVVKKNLDYPSLRKAQFQGSDVFTVNQKEAECIVEFCQENEIKGRGIKIDLSNSKAEIKQKGIQYSLLDQYFLTEKSVSSVTTDYSVESSDYTYEMDYKGKDSLSFIPTRFESTTGDFLVIDLGDITRTIVTYKKKGRSWKPFSIERGGKITYVHPQDVLDPNRDGAMTKVWNGVKSTSSNVADKVSKATEKLGDAAGNVVTKVKDLLTKDEMPETGNN